MRGEAIGKKRRGEAIGKERRGDRRVKGKRGIAGQDRRGGREGRADHCFLSSSDLPTGGGPASGTALSSSCAAWQTVLRSATTGETPSGVPTHTTL